MAGAGGRSSSLSDQLPGGRSRGRERPFGERGTWPGPRRPLPAPGM